MNKKCYVTFLNLLCKSCEILYLHPNFFENLFDKTYNIIIHNDNINDELVINSLYYYKLLKLSSEGCLNLNDLSYLIKNNII